MTIMPMKMEAQYIPYAEDWLKTPHSRQTMQIKEILFGQMNQTLKSNPTDSCWQQMKTEMTSFTAFH